MLFRLRKDMEHAPPESYHRQNHEDVVNRARELLTKLPEGPWEWNGRDEDVKLTTAGRGQVFLMAVDRCGMQGAQFTFQHFKPWDPSPGMKTGKSKKGNPIYVSRASYDVRTIVDIDSPLAAHQDAARDCRNAAAAGEPRSRGATPIAVGRDANQRGHRIPCRHKREKPRQLRSLGRYCQGIQEARGHSIIYEIVKHTEFDLRHWGWPRKPLLDVTHWHSPRTIEDEMMPVWRPIIRRPREIRS